MHSGTCGKTKRPPYETPPSCYSHIHIHLLFTVRLRVQCWCLSMGFEENHWHWHCTPSCLVMATESNPARKILPWAGKECRTAYTTLCGCTSVVLAAVDMFSLSLSLSLSLSFSLQKWCCIRLNSPKPDVPKMWRPSHTTSELQRGLLAVLWTSCPSTEHLPMPCIHVTA